MKVTAVVLAAGLSRRMGTAKMLLSWGDTSVLGHVLRTLQVAGLDNPTVVVGPEREAVSAICRSEGATVVFNPDFETGGMLSSLQVGLRSLPSDCDTALVVLGDQPSLEAPAIQALMDAFGRTGAPLVVPSFRNRRGHPWLVSAQLWPEVLSMMAPDTARDFLTRHGTTIAYVTWETNSDITRHRYSRRVSEMAPVVVHLRASHGTATVGHSRVSGETHSSNSSSRAIGSRSSHTGDSRPGGLDSR